MAAFKRKGGRPTAPRPATEQPSPYSSNGGSARSVETQDRSSRAPSRPRTRRALCVRVKPIEKKDEYVYYEAKDEVEGILREFSKKGDMFYEVRLFGDRTKQVSAAGKRDPSNASPSSKGRAHAVPERPSSLPIRLTDPQPSYVLYSTQLQNLIIDR